LLPAGLVQAGRSGSFEPPASLPKAPLPQAETPPSSGPAPLADGDELPIASSEAAEAADPEADDASEPAAVGEGAQVAAKSPFMGPDGKAVRRRSPPLDGALPFDAKADLLGRMRPGPDGRLQVKTG